jgi:hypothetical protein
MKKINKKIFNYNNTKCKIEKKKMETKDLLLKEKNGFVCNQKFMLFIYYQLFIIIIRILIMCQLLLRIFYVRKKKTKNNKKN